MKLLFKFNPGNSPKRPKIKNVLFSLYFGFTHFFFNFCVWNQLPLLIYRQSYVFLISGLQTGLYPSKEKKRSKHLSTRIICHSYMELKVGGFIFDWGLFRMTLSPPEKVSGTLKFCRSKFFPAEKGQFQHPPLTGLNCFRKVVSKHAIRTLSIPKIWQQNFKLQR